MEETTLSLTRAFLSAMESPWWHFYAMATLSAFVMLLGMMMEKARIFILPFFTVYVLWVLSVGLFLRCIVERSSEFILRCLPYLVSILITIFAVSAGLQLSPDNLYVYIPTCVNIGIILGNGMEHAWSARLLVAIRIVYQIASRCIKGAWERVSRCIIELFATDTGYEDGQLPLFRDRRHDFTLQRRRVSIEVSEALSENVPPLHSTSVPRTPLPLASASSATINEDSNPWTFHL